jgi:hypothetical protein
MFRFALVGLAIVASIIADDSAARPVAAAWPMRVRIDAVHDQPTAFRALSRGATLIMQTGWASSPTHPLDQPVPKVQPLAANDTLHGMTPAQYPLDLTHGSVTIYSSGPESLRVVVGKNPFGMVHQVTAVGRRFTVRFVADSVVIDAR